MLPETTLLQPGVHVHFSGIGGKGIAPAAVLAHAAGLTVTGDDLTGNDRTRALAAEGIPVTTGRNTIAPGAAVHVASAALAGPPSGNPALPRAMARLEFVQNLLTAQGKKVIAVAGSLGKSTAAAMTYQLLSPISPTAYIGADVPGLLCGAALGTGDWAVVEACEYKGAYHALRPDIVIVLNLTENHQDDLGPGTAGFETSLTAFLTGPAAPRLAVMPAEVAELLGKRLAAADSPCPVVETIGEDADWNTEILDASPVTTTFRLTHHGTHAGTWTAPAPGRHIVTAAACGLITAHHLGIPAADAASALARFQLPHRRMTTVHHDDQLVIIDDNARQPGQAAALIQALRQAYPGRHLIIAVAPWGRANRRDLPAWALGLSDADTVWVLPVGDAATPGGEPPDSDSQLARQIRLHGVPAYVTAPGTHLPDLLPRGRASLPLLIATAGYDASVPAFTQLHDAAITAFASQPPPGTPTPAAH
jgi:UDP-N-acetylmuramate-alanine ligase